MTLSITTKSRWIVVLGSDHSVVISEHNQEKEAYESAANYSAEHGGVVMRVKGANFDVVSTPVVIDQPAPSEPSSSSASPSPVDPPATDGGFTVFDPEASHKVPIDATNEQIQQALNTYTDIAFPANMVVENAQFAFTRNHQNIFTYGQGNRPKFIKANDGINNDVFKNDTRTIDHLHVQGLEVFSEKGLRESNGIWIRLSGTSGQYASHIRFEDVLVTGFNNGIAVVDDWARNNNNESRISQVELHGGIIHRQYASDASHSIPLYVEGVVNTDITETCFDMAGWLRPEHRNKRSHCIYAQQFGGPTQATDSWFLRAAANAAQFRSGCKDFSRNIVSECSLGPWITEKYGVIEDNVLLDQTDILPPPTGETISSESRGHGFMGGTNVRRNIATRRGGTQKNHPAYMGLYGTVENNYAIAWAENNQNFDIGGVRYENHNTNKSIEVDPGLPQVTESMIQSLTSRRLGVWDANVHSTAPFRKQCWDIVQEYV
jgi:hypothetical protein